MWNELTELSGLVHDFGGKVGCVGKLSQSDRPPRRYLLSACGYHKPNASIKQAFTYWWRRLESARKLGAHATSLTRSASVKPCLTKPCPRPAWTRVNATWYHQLKNHRKGGLLVGGGGGNRTRVQKPSTGSSTCLVLSFDFDLADADTHAATRRVT